MAQETLPKPEIGNAIDDYNKRRRMLVGKDLLKSGLKTVGLGLFAVAAVALAGITLTMSAGAALAGGAVGYGGAKLLEGGAKRATGK